jgi:exodeoxyribonuclease-5
MPDVDRTLAWFAENACPFKAEPFSGNGQVGRARFDCGAIVLFYKSGTALVQGRCSTADANALDKMLEMQGWTRRLNVARVDNETIIAPEDVDPFDAIEDAAPLPPALALSDDQSAAFARILEWFETASRYLSLGGYAGTGKTTLIKELVRHLRGNVFVAAPTGKAAHVLRCKGVPAQTLHSLIYRTKVVRDPMTGLRKWKFVLAKETFPFVIVDEASMLSTQLVNDLSHVAQRVLYVGDHGQLQPIGDDPGIMHDPNIRLENIHRQAAGSPIIQFAHHVRQGGEPETFGDLARVQRGGSLDLADFDVTICGYNKTRVSGNAWVRRRRGFSGNLPQVGERVICLQNDAEVGVFNGQICTVRETSTTKFTVQDDAGQLYVDVAFDPAQFNRIEKLIPMDELTLWDFGYAVTAHKMQGSESARVAVLEELGKSWSPMRWRYTAATRASEELRWVL